MELIEQKAVVELDYESARDVREDAKTLRKAKGKTLQAVGERSQWTPDLEDFWTALLPWALAAVPLGMFATGGLLGPALVGVGLMNLVGGAVLKTLEKKVEKDKTRPELVSFRSGGPS